MPSDTAQPEKTNDILLSWTFAEFEKHNRPRVWWLWFAGIGLFMLLYAVFTANFLFALIIIIVSAIIIYRNFHEPGAVSITITPLAIHVGDEEYLWSELGSFWLAYEPPEVKKLFLTFSSRIRPHLAIPLEDVSPLAVRDVLSEYLVEDLENESEPTTELLGRMFRI